MVDIWQEEISYSILQKTQHNTFNFENHFVDSCTKGECEVAYNKQDISAMVKAAKTGAQTATRFVTNAKSVTTDLQPTLNRNRIATGGKFPHKNDGSVFKNAEGRYNYRCK